MPTIQGLSRHVRRIVAAATVVLIVSGFGPAVWGQDSTPNVITNNCAPALGGVRDAQCTVTPPVACTAHAGIIEIVTINPPGVTLTAYFNANNYQELPYKTCISIFYFQELGCTGGGGGWVSCKQWDCYASYSALGPICTPNTLVGIDQVKIQECSN